MKIESKLFQQSENNVHKENFTMDTKAQITYNGVPVRDEDQVITEKTTEDPLDKPRLQAKRDLVGFLLATVGTVLLITGHSFAQGLKGIIPPIEMNTIYLATIFIITSTFYSVRKESVMINRKDVPYVAMYVVLIITYFFTFYFAILHLPMGVAGAIRRTIPMILAIPLARIFLKEQVTILKLVGVVVGSIGLVLVCKPDIFVGTEQIQQTFNYTTSNHSTQAPNNSDEIETFQHDSSQNYIGYICGVLTALNSVCHNIIQKMKLQQIEVFKLCFWFSILGTVICLTLSLVFETMVLPHGIKLWSFLILHVVLSCVACFLIIKAQKMAQVVVSQLALSLQIGLAFIAQYFILHSIFPTSGTWIEIFGAVLSTIAVILVPSVQMVMLKCNGRG